jgi:Reverse transcriptase (RNA-dependent DNA polymerase)
MPLHSEIFLRFKNKKIFSKIDLASAYHQIRIKEGSEYLSFFSTPFRSYEYCVMPFGLCTAPAVFQRAITYAIFDLLGENVAVYLQDILVADNLIEDHFELLEKLLRKFLIYNFTGSKEKCQFLRKSVTFCGHSLSESGKTIPREYIEDINSLSPPKTLKDLQRFLGKVNFVRNYIANCAEQIELLARCLKGFQHKLKWES